MTDFVRRITRPENRDWIIRRRTDTDFYTFTMGNFINRYHADVDVAFEFMNRHKHVPYAQIIKEEDLRVQLDHVRSLRFNRTEIFYLRGMDVYGERMFDESYLKYLEASEVPPYDLHWGDEQFSLRFPGKWMSSMEWELFALPIINELFVKTILAEMPECDLRILFARAELKAYEKFQRLKTNPAITVVDFGHRRRAMHLWQRRMIEMAMDVLGPQFLGTSNVHLAAEFGLEPKGTNSHQGQMVRAALADSDEALIQTPYEFMRDYGNVYKHPALRITLPDTFGTTSFYRHMPKRFRRQLATEWRGTRPDSGDLSHATWQFLHFLREEGVDPLEKGQEKLVIPSDGNTVEFMLRFQDLFEKKIRASYVWGTDLTNDLRGCHPRGGELAVIHGRRLSLTWDELLAPHSIVIKPVEANGKPCVKLSDNPKKATGPKGEVDRYLRVFGVEGRFDQVVNM